MLSTKGEWCVIKDNSFIGSRNHMKKILTFILATISPVLLAEDEISPEELERWFNSDSMEPPRYKQVNEGRLVFLANPPGGKLHHHHNSLTILPESLNSGWVILKQCHENIDKVAAAQILFKADRIKDIKIIQYSNIKKVWVEDASVQMENISENATLCLTAYTHSLLPNHDGSYTLRNGPYMRRFFDGYFPLRVTVDLDFRNTNLQLVQLKPEQQDGYTVQLSNNMLHIDTIFEGKLSTEFQFKRIAN